MSNGLPEHGVEGADDFYVGGPNAPFGFDGLGEVERLYENLNDSFDDIIEREPARDQIVVLKPEERTQLLEFYTVAHAYMERVSSILLKEHVSGRDRSEGPLKNQYFWKDMNQASREDLLFEAGVIDAGLKGEMKKVRKVRNELVHNQAKRMYIDFDNKTQSDIKRALDTVKKLDELSR